MTKQFDNFADLITFTRASTGTFLDSDGLLKTATTNTPRIEFDINGNRKGILIEEARTNLLPYSNAFTDAAWGTFGGAVIADDQAVSPDGTTNADQFYGSVGAHIIDQVSTSAGTTLTASLFVKSNGTNQIDLLINYRLSGGGSINYFGARFDIFTETVTNPSPALGASADSATIQDIGNGWYRITVSKVAPTDTATARFFLSSYTASTASEGFFIFGAQMEIGSFPTSYIPTAGAAASRSADVASIPTSAFGYNADKGTVVCEFEVSNYVSGIRRLFSLNADPGNRMDGLLVNNGQLQLFVTDGNVSQAGIFTANGITNNEPSKAAAVYALNDFASVLDGGAIQTDTLGTVPSVSTLSIGNSPVNNWTNGHIKSIQYYPRRLTNAQIIRLTS